MSFKLVLFFSFFVFLVSVQDIIVVLFCFFFFLLFVLQDASPVARVPSFTPYLQAEWESFEKLIAGGGESQKDMSHNAQMFAPIPPVDFSNGSNTIQEIHQREPDDNTMVNESHLHNHSPPHGSLSNSASHSTSSSRSSSLDRPTGWYYYFFFFFPNLFTN